MSAFPRDQQIMIFPADVNKIAARILKLRQRTCEDMIEIGKLLIQAKGRLEHGEWGEWLRRQFAWSQDTAERFINVAEVFGETNSAPLRNLDASALYELARPSTPQEARDTVAGLIEDGTLPALADVRRIIKEARGIDEPEPAPQERPSVQEAALQQQFMDAITALMKLSTKPANTFAGTVPADDLDMLANFLRQIAVAGRKAA